MCCYTRIFGCLLGTAIGDAAGLKREGLSPGRAERLYAEIVAPELVRGLGLCSDDTEHTMMVARSLVLAEGNVAEFERHMASHLKRWLLCLPAGVGFATLRACLKLLLGLGPRRSGVFSAGNGPAMRAAILGAYAQSDSECVELVSRSTRLTHTDPKAEEGALLVARAASLSNRKLPTPPIQFLHEQVPIILGDELRSRLMDAINSLAARRTPAEFAARQGWKRGVSGYVNETVPAALYCWASSPNDFRQCVTSAVLLGGDTDSVGAIAGGIAGANLGDTAIPRDWVRNLNDWPRTVNWIEHLAHALASSRSAELHADPPSMRWLATLPRNALFAIVILSLGFRRLLPPY